ncbi:hypothetical protein ACJZ2D_009012 [Fusarium nematophilum]
MLHSGVPLRNSSNYPTALSNTRSTLAGQKDQIQASLVSLEQEEHRYRGPAAFGAVQKSPRRHHLWEAVDDATRALRSIPSLGRQIAHLICRSRGPYAHHLVWEVGGEEESFQAYVLADVCGAGGGGILWDIGKRACCATDLDFIL